MYTQMSVERSGLDQSPYGTRLVSVCLVRRLKRRTTPTSSSSSGHKRSHDGRPGRGCERLRDALQFALRRRGSNRASAALREDHAPRLISRSRGGNESYCCARMLTVKMALVACVARPTARLVDADLRGKTDPRSSCHHQRVCKPGKCPCSKLATLLRTRPGSLTCACVLFRKEAAPSRASKRALP